MAASNPQVYLPRDPDDGRMTTPQHTVSFLGLGEMGSALARAALSAGHPTTVWNRSPDKAIALIDAGGRAVKTAAEAIEASDLIVMCLFDHRSVHEVLDPLADRLAGRHLINLTTTSPEGARELAQWAAGVGADYLDGGIMATPEMIGTQQSRVLCCTAGRNGLTTTTAVSSSYGASPSISASTPASHRCTTWPCSRVCM
jgi:3-hydroxyisobutyrate dehydrogenase-like beta-hydroxyacid dehydrogenase